MEYTKKNIVGSGQGGHYITLSQDCLLRLMEAPHIYNIQRDELYEIDQEAFDFITHCDGSQKLADLNPDTGFLQFCLEEKILTLSPCPQVRPISREPVTLISPSLRYLEIQITNRCNLRCRHCYIDHTPELDLPLQTIEEVIAEFDRLQGIKLLISGGEPFLYPQLEGFLDYLSKVNLRKVLLTNGTLITPEKIPKLKTIISELQISLDGLQKGHEYFRGQGTFRKSMSAIELCRREGLDVSVATMLHPENLEEIEPLSAILKDLGVKEWGIDVPYNIKASAQTKFFGLEAQKAAPYLSFAYGGSFHGGTEGFACGRHLCTVTPNGSVCKCDFYTDNPVGQVTEGLARCWARIYHIPLSHLSCSSCLHQEECGGDCRKRAEDDLGKDPIMCAFYQKI